MQCTAGFLVSSWGAVRTWHHSLKDRTSRLSSFLFKWKNESVLLQVPPPNMAIYRSSPA